MLNLQPPAILPSGVGIEPIDFDERDTIYAPLYRVQPIARRQLHGAFETCQSRREPLNGRRQDSAVVAGGIL
jgi:hypothetical protein